MNRGEKTEAELKEELRYWRKKAEELEKAVFVPRVFYDIFDKTAECDFRIAELISDGFGIQDENEKILYVNPSLCELLGYDKNELVGSDVREI